MTIPPMMSAFFDGRFDFFFFLPSPEELSSFSSLDRSRFFSESPEVPWSSRSFVCRRLEFSSGVERDPPSLMSDQIVGKPATLTQR